MISLKAGGVGLNLTAADVVIHYDPWWNVAAQDQATDRAHRIGQQHTVTVYKLIAKDTIEERIMQMQESKRDLVNSVLGGDGISSALFTREDVLTLLGGDGRQLRAGGTAGVGRTVDAFWPDRLPDPLCVHLLCRGWFVCIWA